MRKLVLSTDNINKARELREILKDLPLEILTKKEAGVEDLRVVEDGDTLEYNSLKKARELADLVDHMVMADDSGLFVDVLDGAPGVYSSRYGGEDGNDALNNQTLLENLQGKDRRAAFKTVIALITEDGSELTVQGECRGKILEEPMGENGFGYDPLFVPDGYTETFAQLPGEIKNSISHRRRAIDALREKLEEILSERH
jgi:XTP/dITP diphosphohydrolase